MTAEPMAKPLVTALVVLPTASRLTMIRSGSPSNSPGHLGDAGGVVGDRAEGVLRDDDAGGGEHAHAGEGHQVEGELDVAVAQPDADAERRGDGDDRVDARLEAGADAREHDRGRAGAGRLGDLAHRAVSVEVKYSVRRLSTWASTRPMMTAPKHFQPASTLSLPT